MADRTTIAKTTAPGAYAGSGTEFAWTAADATNKNRAVIVDGKTLLLARNGHATDAKTFTVNSTDDQYGRTEDITAQSLAAGEYAVFGPVRLNGWAQSGNYLHFEGSTADILFAVIDLP